jgi:hypothetical protein
VRLAIAIGVIAVTLAAAVYVHERRVSCFGGHRLPHGQCRVLATDPAGATMDVPASLIRGRPSWENPAAVLLAIGGLAVAAGILTARRNFAKPS